MKLISHWKEEDKADVFAYLMVTDLYVDKTKKIINQDSILKKKINHIKSFLKGISSEFKEEYFEKIHEKIRTCCINS
jgi:hypothetical protein